MSTVTSRVMEIFAAVAAQTVTIASTAQAISALGLDGARDSIEAADLPVRLIMPFENSRQRESGRPAGIAPLYRAMWAVTDVLLYAAANSGLGLVEFAPVLTEYAGAYLGLVANVRAPVPGAGITLEDWSCQPQMIEYPQGSGNWYYGAVCTISYVENVTLQG